MSMTFSHAIQTQGRTLWALSLREIHGKHGKSRLGYLWQIIKTGFGILVFWGIREITGAKAPQGLPVPLFLLMGFIPWYIFSETIGKTLEAVPTNKQLLTFPQITPLDLMVSSAIVCWVTEIVIMGMFFLVFAQIGYGFILFDPFAFVLSLLGIGLFSLGLGLVLAALSTYLPILEKLVPMVMRILFLTSAVFFSPMQLSKKYGDIIMWNPLINFIELLRGSFVYHTPAEIIRVHYIVYLTGILLAVGLLLERYVRKRWAHI